MSIKNWLVRGDTHGNFLWMLNGVLDGYEPEETAIIILGDAGLNFYLNKTDTRKKREVNDRGYLLYCVRGNHEARPTSIPGMETMFDENVAGYVFYEPDFSNIRYFLDVGIYTISDYRCLVLGGAYSVDKGYRLASAGILDEVDNNPKKTGWWADECLSEAERAKGLQLIEDSKNYTFDFVFSHTCPKKYQPTDLFLGFVDQSTVDDSMEVWMDEISEKIEVNYAWCFGHYHQDRIERPHVEQFFNDVDDLESIARRWYVYDETGELAWFLKRSPFFFEEDA